MMSALFFLLFTVLYTYVNTIQAPVNTTQSLTSSSKTPSKAPQNSVEAQIEKQATTLIDTTVSIVQKSTISDIFHDALQQLDTRAQEAIMSISKAPETLSQKATSFTALYEGIKNFSDQSIEKFERDAQDSIINTIIKVNNLDIAKNFKDLNKEALFENTIINEVARGLQEHTRFLVQQLNEFASHLLDIPLLPNNVSLTTAYIDEKKKLIGAPTFAKQNVQRPSFWNSIGQYANTFAQEFGISLQNKVEDAAQELVTSTIGALRDQFKETRGQIKETLTNKALRSLGVEPTQPSTEEKKSEDKKKQIEEQNNGQEQPETEEVQELEELSQELEPEVQQEESRAQFELVNNNKRNPIDLYYLGNVQTNLLTQDKDFLLQGYSSIFPGGRLQIEYPSAFRRDEPIILVLRITTPNFQQFKYYIFNPEKNIFLEVNNENKNLVPASDKSGKGLTESGLSLKNNSTVSDIKEGVGPDKRPVLFNDPREAIKHAKDRASRM